MQRQGEEYSRPKDNLVDVVTSKLYTPFKWERKIDYHMVCKVVADVQILNLPVLAQFFKYIFVKVLQRWTKAIFLKNVNWFDKVASKSSSDAFGTTQERWKYGTKLFTMRLHAKTDC